MSRVYLPMTLDALAAYVEHEEVRDVERIMSASDDEADEYAALMAAAAASQRVLAGPGRRVVVVAEGERLDDETVAVPLRLVVAVHVDAGDREVDADPDDDLAWFASQEIDQILDSR